MDSMLFVHLGAVAGNNQLSLREIKNITITKLFTRKAFKAKLTETDWDVQWLFNTTNTHTRSQKGCSTSALLLQ